MGPNCDSAGTNKVIPRKLNEAADSLSRDTIPSFLQLVPEERKWPKRAPGSTFHFLYMRYMYQSIYHRVWLKCDFNQSGMTREAGWWGNIHTHMRLQILYCKQHYLHKIAVSKDEKQNISISYLVPTYIQYLKSHSSLCTICTCLLLSMNKEVNFCPLFIQATYQTSYFMVVYTVRVIQHQRVGSRSSIQHKE